MQTDPQTEPFMQAAINWGMRSSGILPDGVQIGPGDCAVFIRNIEIPEVVEFDTRSRTVRYILFCETPEPVWNRPGVGLHPSYTLPQRDGRSEGWDMQDSNIVRYQDYVGPFRVTWRDELGHLGNFEVK